MENSEEYGPALPPALQQSSGQPTADAAVIGPTLPPGFVKQEPGVSPQINNTEETSAAVAAIGPEAPQDTQQTDSGDATTTTLEGGYTAGGAGTIGPLVSEMSHGDEVVQAAEEFERRSRKMKDQLTVKAEAQPGPSKREEWMTELPPEMGKNFGLTARTFSKGAGPEDKDRSEWTDTPADKAKKEKEGKGSKKRKRDDSADKNPAKQRDQQLQQQVDEHNKKKRPESLVEMHQKQKKKKKTPAQNQNAAADSTQSQAQQQSQQQSTAQSQTQTPAQPHTIQQLTPQQQQQLQQQQVVTANGDQLQFMQLSEDIRDSLDLLGEQKTPEYFSGEFQSTEFGETKPLADLLLNQNMVSYNQDGTVFSQGGAVLNTSQMIAQAYNQAQQLSTTTLNQHPIFASGLAGQVGHNMGITIIPATAQDGQTTLQDGQATVVDESQAAGTLQALGGTYTTNIVGSSQSGSSSISAFPLGQNVIIASPGTQQAGNFIFSPSGQSAGMGQNIVIAAPGQQGSYQLVKQETQEELAQTLVLASQNPQQNLGSGIVMAQNSSAQTATLSDGSSVVFTHPPLSATPTSDSQTVGKTVSVSAKSLQSSTGQGQGGMQPVSLVLPPVNSIFPQLQNIPTATTSPNMLQLGAKIDKMLLMMQETLKNVADTNKRLDRIEAHLSMTPPTGKAKKSKSSSSSSSSSPTAAATSTATASSSSTATTTAGPSPSKSELKAALADYLTITDFSNKDELRRNESSSDLFIPVGTVSLPIQDPQSPSLSEGGGETATSTVSELPDQNLLVLNEPVPAHIVNTPDATTPDSQSGIAVTIYDSEGATYELGPDSSKDNAGGRFTTVSQNPKTVIVDPKFWEMLVEDFQKNMTSKQIMSALSEVRKPLVRNMGNNEISICSSVLKEAEEACQGRRERLAKELVFRIFTLGEVYDRNVSGVFYIKGKKMENKNKALDPAKMSAIRFLVMRYPPSVLDNPRLEKLVWKNCVDRINDALRRIYNWIHKLVDINSIIDKLPTESVLQSP